MHTNMRVSVLLVMQAELFSLLGLPCLILQLLFGTHEHNDVKSISQILETRMTSCHPECV